MELEQATSDVGAAPTPPPVVEADSSPAPETSEESSADVKGSEEKQQVVEEADPLKDVPTLEELEQQAANKVPYAQALKNLRAAYEGVKPQIDRFEPWKAAVENIGDPAQAQTAYELVRSIQTPVEGQPNEFTSKPFIDRIDQERPGSANQLFHDLLTYEVPDENGRMDTLVRHMYRAHGLDPDRVDDYRNIDTLRTSGIVSAEDLNRVPEKYREAFRALSQDGQEDILQLLRANEPLYGLRAEEHLRNAQDALEARQWREQADKAREQAAQQQAVEFRQHVEQAVESDIGQQVQSIHDSILQKSLSQVTFSSDATQDTLEKSKILSVVANLQSPYPFYRDLAVRSLKAVGVEVNGWDKLTQDWEHERSKYVALQAAGQGDTWDGREALSKSNFMYQQILARASDYVLKLAQAGGSRAAEAAAQQGSQLETATARFVPSGGGQIAQGDPNPYANNPHPFGTPEYFKFNRDIDKQYGLNAASVFSR